ncbi:MAG: MBL fold metallo-hydrolase [Bacteroidota bacterium]
MIHVLDLKFLGIDHAIAAFLIETKDGPVLIETGPHSTFNHLEEQVKQVGFDINDIKHVLLTHIHLDHAGAAWALARKGAKIFVHPFGAGHLEHPFKLMESARRIYLDQMDYLWGEMHDISGEQIIQPQDNQVYDIGGINFQALYTPGHAKHHIAWKIGKTLFSGDVAGVKIGDGPVVPPCPPPDINLEEWNDSIDLIVKSDVNEIYLTHYGKIKNIESHFEQLRTMLNDWGQWIKARWETESIEEMTPKFSKYTEEQLRELGVDDHGVKQYEAANPSWMSVAGLVRYWKKKSEL